jgi:hypothetical protein
MRHNAQCTARRAPQDLDLRQARTALLTADSRREREGEEDADALVGAADRSYRQEGARARAHI